MFPASNFDDFLVEMLLEGRVPCFLFANIGISSPDKDREKDNGDFNSGIYRDTCVIMVVSTKPIIRSK